jgi:hypothetical protein
MRRHGPISERRVGSTEIDDMDHLWRPNGSKEVSEKARQAVQLAEWAATMLIGAEQLGIKDKPVARFPLSKAERAVLLITLRVDEKMHSKLEMEKPSPTVGEVGSILMAVAEAMFDAPPLQCSALSMAAKSLMGCLEEEVEGAFKPTPGSKS